MGYLDNQAEREASKRMSDAIRKATGFENGAARQDTGGIQVRDKTGRFAVSGRGLDQGAGRGSERDTDNDGHDEINNMMRARLGIVPADEGGGPQGTTVGGISV